METFMLLSLAFAIVGTNVFAAPYNQLWQHVKRTSDDPDQRCNTMQTAVKKVFDDVWTIVQHPGAFKLIEEFTGMPNLEDLPLEGVEKQFQMMQAPYIHYACQIAKVTSLKQLAEVFHVDVNEVRFGYGMMMSLFQSMGGNPREILQKSYEIDTFILQELENAGFPNWPLQASQSEIAMFLTYEMPAKFGRNWVRLMFLNPHAPVNDGFGYEEIQAFYQSLAEATSSEEAGMAIGQLSSLDMPSKVKSVVFTIFEALVRDPIFSNLITNLIQDVISTASLAEEYGLFNLN